MSRVRKGYPGGAALLLALALMPAIAAGSSAAASEPGVWSPNGRAGVACAIEVKDPWLRLRSAICPPDRDEFRRIAWTLYPEEPPPGPSSRSIVIAVHEPWCSSGRNPLPYLGPPEVRYSEKAVVIVLWIDPPDGGLCPGNPLGRLVVRLPGPLGSRQLYDGGSEPPRKVKPGEDPRRLPWLDQAASRSARLRQ